MQNGNSVTKTQTIQFKKWAKDLKRPISKEAIGQHTQKDEKMFKVTKHQGNEDQNHTGNHYQHNRKPHVLVRCEENRTLVPCWGERKVVSLYGEQYGGPQNN